VGKPPTKSSPPSPTAAPLAQRLRARPRGVGPRSDPLLRELAANGELLVATHLPFPSVGHVAVAGDAFRWVPVFWDY